MPNWTENTLTLEGTKEDLDRFVAECCDEHGLDFDKIVPKPEGFDATLTSGSDDIAYALYYAPTSHEVRMYFQYPWVKEKGVEEGDVDALIKLLESRFRAPDNTRSYKELSDAYKRNIDLTGCKTWYEWNVKNWGTKWGACEPRMDRHDGMLEITFNTAWSEPALIFDAIRRRFWMLDGEYVARHEGDDEITGRRWYGQDQAPEDDDD